MCVERYFKIIWPMTFGLISYQSVVNKYMYTINYGDFGIINLNISDDSTKKRV